MPLPLDRWHGCGLFLWNMAFLEKAIIERDILAAIFSLEKRPRKLLRGEDSRRTCEGAVLLPDWEYEARNDSRIQARGTAQEKNRP